LYVSGVSPGPGPSERGDVSALKLETASSAEAASNAFLLASSIKEVARETAKTPSLEFCKVASVVNMVLFTLSTVNDNNNKAY